MNTTYATSHERIVDERTNEQKDGFEDESALEVDERPERRASVEQEIQGTVDTNHPDARGVCEETNEHLTLIQEERIEGRERELERISEQAAVGPQAGRERRSREAVAERVGGRRERLRVGYDEDPRERLSKDELAAVHQRAAYIEDGLTFAGQHRAIARQIAERVVNDRESVIDAALHTREALVESRGVVKPLARVRPEQWSVTVEAEVVRLFEPASPAQQQVGIIEDSSGSVKLTIWRSAEVGTVLHEGDRVRIHDASPGRFGGETTLAAERKAKYGTVYKQTRITVLEPGDGPAPRRPRWGPVYDDEGNVVQDRRSLKRPSSSL
ncbi:hypothetical protein [Halococcus salifodinae]|uniref:OB-fold nucleic acid binding domain protein n=1 Tax=Halococcus salifodinae DSM 8989 TaxID=1227456 RepID=M0N3C0_9EURY|nr:hypothetical protein [Halococcus salifodinae]EMA52013.1 hypothetical protein C450_11878 [Halococcus salifodinae DSM 8989]